MVRLLYLAPVIAVIGIVLVLYMIFLRPVAKNAKGEDVSATVALDEIKTDLKKVKEQQDILAGNMEAQKQGLLLESTNATKLYEQASRDEFHDLDLVKLKESISVFNSQALELAGNETAIIQFNDQLREGIAGLDKQIREIDLNDLLRPKEDVGNRLNSLKIQVSKLVELQKAIIEKSKEYNDRSRESVQALKVTLREQAQNIAGLKTDRTAVLEEKIQKTMASQEEMLLHIKEQEGTLMNIRLQNLEQMRISKERVASLLEQMKDKIATDRDKNEDNKAKMLDAKDRLESAQERARDSRERTREMQELLKDRRR